MKHRQSKPTTRSAWERHHRARVDLYLFLLPPLPLSLILTGFGYYAYPTFSTDHLARLRRRASAPAHTYPRFECRCHTLKIGRSLRSTRDNHTKRVEGRRMMVQAVHVFLSRLGLICTQPSRLLCLPYLPFSAPPISHPLSDGHATYCPSSLLFPTPLPFS